MAVGKPSDFCVNKTVLGECFSRLCQQQTVFIVQYSRVFSWCDW